MFGWRGTRRRKVVAERVDIADEAPPPRPTWRVVEHQHSGQFMVQHLQPVNEYSPFSPWGYKTVVTFGNAEMAIAWIEREVVGPKVVKEFPCAWRRM